MMGNGWMNSGNPNDDKTLENIGKYGWPFILGGGAIYLAKKAGFFTGVSAEATKGSGKASSFADSFMNEVASMANSAVSFAIDVGEAALILGSAGLAGYGVLKAYQTVSVSKNLEAIRIIPDATSSTDPAKVAEMVKSFATFFRRSRFIPRAWFSWLFTRNSQGMIEFRCITPKQRMRQVIKKLQTVYPKAIIETDEEGTNVYQKNVGEIGLFKLELDDKAAGLAHQVDIGDLLVKMPRNSLLEIRFSPTTIKEIAEDSRDRLGRILASKHKTPETTEQKKAIMNRYYKRQAFDVQILLWARNGIFDWAKEISNATQDENRLELKQFKLLPDLRNPLNWDFWYSPLPWRVIQLNDKELAPFFTIPEPSHSVREYIDVAVPKVKPAPDELTKGICFGKLDTREKEKREIRVPVKILCNHGFVAGMSGGGKGAWFYTFMDDFLKSWVTKKNAAGLTYCDPHTTGILKTISQLLELERQGYNIPWHRVKVISFGDLGSQYPIAMNLMYRFSDEKIDNIVSDVAWIIKSAFGTDLSKYGELMKNALHALLWNTEEVTTIADIGRLFQADEEVFITRSIKQIGNPYVKKWWLKQIKKMQNSDGDWVKDISVDPIENRINPFLSMRSMQRFFCRKENELNVRQIIENGDLVLVDFMGAPDEAFRLVAGWLALKYYRESQRRGEGGKPHFLIFDEVKKFDVQEIFESILRENRKFNLGLILMTQFLEDLSPNLVQALENTAFRVSLKQTSNAKKMSQVMSETFTPEQLQFLKKGEEAALWTAQGSANIKLLPPAYILNGKVTGEDSPEAKEAKEIALEKMKELMARDFKSHIEVDKEVAELFGEKVENRHPKEKAAEEQTKAEQADSSPKRKVVQLQVAKRTQS